MSWSKWPIYPLDGLLTFLWPTAQPPDGGWDFFRPPNKKTPTITRRRCSHVCEKSKLQDR
jgi:hypothetical protein